MSSKKFVFNNFKIIINKLQKHRDNLKLLFQIIYPLLHTK